jgi:hypothetical protein
MVKKLSIIILISLLLSACHRDRTDYAEYVKGTWVCQEIDNLIIPNHAFFSVTFGDNGQGNMGYVRLLDYGTEWFKDDFLHYQVSDNLLSYYFSDSLVSHWEIERIDKNTMVVKARNDSQQEPPVYRYFRLYKKDADKYKNALAGAWEIYQKFSPDSLFPLLGIGRFENNGNFSFDDDHMTETVDRYWGNYFLNEDILSVNSHDLLVNSLNVKCKVLIIDSISNKEIDMTEWQNIGDGMNTLHAIRYKLIKLNY